MYPLGVLFGLGFDTSSEIALLGISSVQATRGTSLWLILIFPVLFTAGMCLIDTIDGAAMLVLYSSASLARDAVAVLYYNTVLTGITVVVAVVIGVLQLLGLVVAVVGEDRLESGGAAGFWRGVVAVGDRYDVVGGAICGLFVVAGVGSVVLYKPWRRWVDREMLADGVAAPVHEEARGEEEDIALADAAHGEVVITQPNHDVEAAAAPSASNSQTRASRPVGHSSPKKGFTERVDEV